MKKARYLFLFFACLGIFSCNSGKKPTETITRGTTSIMVDETFYPMIDGQVQVFESQYKYAHLNIITLPEQEIAQALQALDTSRIAILSRELTPGEIAHLENAQIIPKTTAIAIDAIALIMNKGQKDSVITTAHLKNLISGNVPDGFKLVFENSGSSTVQYMMNFAGIDQLTGKNIFSVNNSKELIEFITENENAIGFVGVDWLFERDEDSRQYLEKVKVLGVGDSGEYYKPNQNDIAEGKYPFTRTIYIINYQGTAGLGMGFASFIAGDVGQRIILKAGMVPTIFPKREVKIRTKI